MKKFNCILLALIFNVLLLTDGKLMAQTAYYIHPNGVDIGNGSQTAPFKTLNFASRKAGRGDTIYLLPGKYLPLTDFEFTVVNGPANTSNGKTIIKPKVEGTVTIDGKKCTLEPTKALITLFREHIVFEGIKVKNSPRRGIYIQKPDMVIRNCEIDSTQTHGITGWSENILVENNIIHNTVLNNNGGDDFCSFDSQGKLKCGGWDQAISLSRKWEQKPSHITFSRNVTIRNNTVYNNWGEGIMLANCIDCKVEGNRVYDNFAVCIWLGKSRNIKVSRNFLYITNDNFNRVDNGRRAVGVHFSNELAFELDQIAIDNVTIDNNLIVGCSVGLNHWYDKDHNNSTRNTYSNIRFYYNNILKPQFAPIKIDAVPADNTQPYGCEMLNNILEEKSSPQTILNNREAWNVRYNNWVNAKPSFILHSSNFVGDPLFVGNGQGEISDPGSYRLSKSSPNYRRGIAIPEINDDFYQTDIRAYPRFTPTCIGAHELQKTAVEVIDYGLLFSIYPNPVSYGTPLTVECLEQGVSGMVITLSKDGNVVYQNSFLKAKALIPIYYPAGLYLINIKTNIREITKKLVIE